MFAFKFEVRTKMCPCKNKTIQQTNSYLNNQLFKVLSNGTNTLTDALDRRRLVWVTGK